MKHSNGKREATPGYHSVQMKRHFLVQPHRYPFSKIGLLGLSSGDMAVQFTLLPIRVGRTVRRSVAGRRPRITVDATAKTQGTTTDIILLLLPVPPPPPLTSLHFGQNLAQLRLGNLIVP